MKEIGSIIKVFLIMWVCVFAILAVVSCVIYKDAIANTVANNMWAMINGLMPLVIILLGIGYAIRCLFK